VTRKSKRPSSADEPAVAPAGHVSSSTAVEAPTVVDNLPDTVPITTNELDVIEMFLTDIIDQLLDDKSQERSIESWRKLAPLDSC
jgi:hypothetical protein